MYLTKHLWRIDAAVPEVFRAKPERVNKSEKEQNKVENRGQCLGSHEACPQVVLWALASPPLLHSGFTWELLALMPRPDPQRH